jgi:hypothetical protein
MECDNEALRRRLERERDEAKALLEQERSYRKTVLGAMLEQAKREGDDLREQLKTLHDKHRELWEAVDPFAGDHDQCLASARRSFERLRKLQEERDIARLHHHALWQLLAPCAITPTEVLESARQKLVQLARAESACSTWAEASTQIANACEQLREQMRLAEQEMTEQRRARILAENERAKAEERTATLTRCVAVVADGVMLLDGRDMDSLQDTAPECPRCGRLVQDCRRARAKDLYGSFVYREFDLDCRAHEYLTRALKAEEERDEIRGALADLASGTCSLTTIRRHPDDQQRVEAIWRRLINLEEERTNALNQKEVALAGEAEALIDLAHAEERLRQAQEAAAEHKAFAEARIQRIGRERDAARAQADAATRERDAAHQSYLLVVDAVCKESSSREQVAEAARTARADRDDYLVQLNELTMILAGASEPGELAADTARRLSCLAEAYVALREVGAACGIATRPVPLPHFSAGPRIVDLVVADLRERATAGEQHYGQPLRPFNGRPCGIDAYHEVLDLAHYARQDIEEKRAMLARVRETIADGVTMSDPAARSLALLPVLGDIERWLAPYAPEAPQPIEAHPTPEWARSVSMCTHTEKVGDRTSRCGKPPLCDTIGPGRLPRCAEHASKYRAPVSGPGCARCNDTHLVKGDGCPDFDCPDCPSPCHKCSAGVADLAEHRPYCATHPCPCLCHKPTSNASGGGGQ